MKKELAAKYDHHAVEREGIYDTWVKEGYFTAGDKTKTPYCVVIPPPNVTGKLHLGHAWDNTLQDIIARFKRLQGYDMLYLPGMDHAGIATQAKVDARLKGEGISRFDLGREGFLKRAWEWKSEYVDFIRTQWAKLGISVDYTKERFTLDDGLSQAVQRVFIDLYKDGLIYQGERIINWDPQAQTALSNIEVIHKEVEGAMYHFYYTIEETGERIVVATTRPETMFGDVCVVVHPDDSRYAHLHGKHAINPANHEALPIITDDYIDMEFGTGAMKCTPAHDPNDFTIAEKYGLEKIVCIHPNGTMNALAGAFADMDRFACRKALVARIEEEGNLLKIEKMMHQVGHSERTDVIVEPYLSKQWFVRMQPLAKEVLSMQEKGEEKIHFYPQRFEGTFLKWMENIEDWCISRQLWWGHRIPAYYHKDTQEIHVGESPQDIENWIQDEDVLDTWFSSALWPFSTLGWPNESEDFKRYYPTNCLVTGYDIIFFWVARMAFQGRYFTGQRPFKDVLIHGLIRDSHGRKMSKSSGNGIDPLDVIDRYGVDALRFFLTTNSTPGQDMRYMEEKVEAAWNFINKIWNASRFVCMNIEDVQALPALSACSLSMSDEWILGRLDEVIASVSSNMEKYEFAMVGNELYSFVWDDFCSWYIELSKANINSEVPAVKEACLTTLHYVFVRILQLLHPFMPFVTEEIYSVVQPERGALIESAWPAASGLGNDVAKARVADVISMIQAVREIRVQYQVKPSLTLGMVITNHQNIVLAMDDITTAMLEKMANVEIGHVVSCDCVVRPVRCGAVHIPLNEIVDPKEELKKLSKEQERLVQEIKRGEGMLANAAFVSKAPAAKLEQEHAKLEDYRKQYERIVQEIKKYEN